MKKKVRVGPLGSCVGRLGLKCIVFRCLFYSDAIIISYINFYSPPYTPHNHPPHAPTLSDPPDLNPSHHLSTP